MDRRTDREADDHAEAIARARRAWRDGHRPDVDRRVLAAQLGMLLLRQSDGEDDVPPGAIARELEAEADHAGDPDARAVLDLYAGLVRLRDADADDVAALDTQLIRMAAVLPAVPDDLPGLAGALHALGEACVLTERLDLGAAVVARWRSLPYPGPDPADPVDQVEIDIVDAGLAEVRMWRDEDPAALDRVLDLLGRARSARPDDRLLTAWLAERLVLRAVARRTPHRAGPP